MCTYCVNVCLSICMCVWICVCMFVFIFVYVCVGICVCVCNVHVCMYYVCVYACVHVVYMYVCIYVSVFMCAGICVYVYACMFVYMYTCVSTGIYLLRYHQLNFRFHLLWHRYALGQRNLSSNSCIQVHKRTVWQSLKCWHLLKYAGTLILILWMKDATEFLSRTWECRVDVPEISWRNRSQWQLESKDRSRVEILEELGLLISSTDPVTWPAKGTDRWNAVVPKDSKFGAEFLKRQRS